MCDIVAIMIAFAFLLIVAANAPMFTFASNPSAVPSALVGQSQTILWPGSILTTPCTNTHPIQNEMCQRSCSVDSDCFYGMYCDTIGGVKQCTCSPQHNQIAWDTSRSCGPNNICMGNGLIARCFCGTNAACNNGGCAIDMSWQYTPDGWPRDPVWSMMGQSWTENLGNNNEHPISSTQDSYWTSNLEWARFGFASYATAANPIYYHIIPDGSIWSTSTPWQDTINAAHGGPDTWFTYPHHWGVGFPGLSFTPPTCQCNEGWNGPVCDNNISQMSLNICGAFEAVQPAANSSSVDLWSLTGVPASIGTTYLWPAHSGMDTTNDLNRVMGSATSVTAAASILNKLYCRCDFAWGPLTVDRLAYNQGLLAPGSACSILDQDTAYCSQRTALGSIAVQGVWNVDRCKCNAGRSGTSCQYSCGAQYCSGHLPVNVDCTNGALQNFCSYCDVGWGPTQDSTAYLEIDPFYTQTWCGVPSGPDYTSDASGQLLECSGGGIAVNTSVISAIFGLPTELVYVAFISETVYPHFNTHPIYIQTSLDQRYPNMLSTNVALLLAMNHDYLVYYNTRISTPCVCDPGFLPDGMSCKPSICQEWKSCDRDDVACVRNANTVATPATVATTVPISIMYNQSWVSKQSVVARSVINMATVTRVSPGILSVVPGTTISAVFDGVTIKTGDRVLIMNQTRAQDNGIYVAQSGITSFIRAPDANSASDLNRGAQVAVDGGLIYASTMWTLQPPPTRRTIGTATYILDTSTGVSYQIFNGNKAWMDTQTYNALGRPAYVNTDHAIVFAIPGGVTYENPWYAYDPNNGAIFQVAYGMKYWLNPDQYAWLGRPGAANWATVETLPNAPSGPIYSQTNTDAQRAQFLANAEAAYLIQYTTFILDAAPASVVYVNDPRSGYCQVFVDGTGSIGTRNYLDGDLYSALGSPTNIHHDWTTSQIDPLIVGIVANTVATANQRAQVLANVASVGIPLGAQIWLLSDQSPTNAILDVTPPVYSDGYTTSQLCAQTMFAGSSIPRGTCAVTTIANVPTFACACASGYGGPNCGILRCSWANGQVCAGNGACNTASNRCICNDGWVGMACEISSAVDTCHQHGQISRGNPSFVGNSLGETPVGQFPNPDMLTATLWY